MYRLILLFCGLLTVACLSGANASFAQDVIPPSRAVVQKDVDFYGSDLQSIYGTDRSTCNMACVDMKGCVAYTFNARYSSCFLKRSITDVSQYKGAVSGEIILTAPDVIARAKTRANELSFLETSDFAAARAMAVNIGVKYPAGEWFTDDLLASAKLFATEGNIREAARLTGAAVSRSDLAEHWTQLGQHLLDSVAQTETAQSQTDHNAQRKGAHEAAFGAAMNAYLRAPEPTQQVAALLVLSEALERLGRGRDMLSALRLAESFGGQDGVAARLSGAVRKYGLRVEAHEVFSDLAQPKVCARFSEELIEREVDYTPYVATGDSALVVSAAGRNLCLEGFDHGAEFKVTFRKGLPAKSGETLQRPVDLTFYVRDRQPSVRFAGDSYVLPKTDQAAVPVETVNLDQLDISLHRVSDRNILRLMQDGILGAPLEFYQRETFENDLAQKVWSGNLSIKNKTNQTIKTRVPMAEAIKDQSPGLYVLSAGIKAQNPYDPLQSQWFVVSDLGITTMKGTDGLHVFVNSLSDAQPREGVALKLMSRANEVLAHATTDAGGYGVFPAGVLRGTAGAAPALVVATAGDDLSYLSLVDPAFDLSDRGVEGRPSAGHVDIFASTDRGAYRAGETIHVTALARDAQMQALDTLPLTAVLLRPDGVEYKRKLSTASKAGGHVFSFPLSDSVARGTWQVAIYSDPEGRALTRKSVLVEDFLPDRVEFDLTLAQGILQPDTAHRLDVDAKYLFGAKGADLSVSGRVSVTPLRELDAYPGYQFGPHDQSHTDIATSKVLDRLKTDAEGRATYSLRFPEAAQTNQPLKAEVQIELREDSGRPVLRHLERTIAPRSPAIGIKPEFDGVLNEWGLASFSLLALDKNLEPVDLPVRWTLNRVRTDYQWYQMDGRWQWEAIVTREPVQEAKVNLGKDPVIVSAPVEWGEYELVVEHEGGIYTRSSVGFAAGWHAGPEVSQTPDKLDMSLDRAEYSPGDTAQLRIFAPHAGTALVTVLSNQLIHHKAVAIKKGDNLIPLDVTDTWGTGAYVSAQLLRAMDVGQNRNPARALGVNYAKIDPGTKQLRVKIEAPELSAPRGQLSTAITVDGIAQGETAYVTLAAVDVGVLNITGFQSPDPSQHYFGQQALGMEIRDIYGRLLDGLNGAMGKIRPGGDGAGQAALAVKSPPPNENLVTFFQGPVAVDAQGRAEISFDVPDFNGTLRLMAVAWSQNGVGAGQSEVVIRDPVVLTASLPRFMAPGDESRLLLDIAHVDGPAGKLSLAVNTKSADGGQDDGGLTIDKAALPKTLTLRVGEKSSLSVPIVAQKPGDHRLQLVLSLEDGTKLTKNLVVPVRMNDPVIAKTRHLSLAPGETFTLDDAVFAGLRADLAVASVSSGALARVDVAGLMQQLHHYPFACTEQVTSSVMPLLYLSKAAKDIGLLEEKTLNARIMGAVDQLLTRQNSTGAFGLWRPGSGDIWLTAYVTDFLSRARAEGYDIPQEQFQLALNNLRNYVSQTSEVTQGGQALAYALMILAREGAANVADLRYYADAQAQAFSSALALAQLGSALVFSSDQPRADKMFELAKAKLRATAKAPEDTDEQASRSWRDDYGSWSRDAAATLTLAAEAGSKVFDPDDILQQLAQSTDRLSTQEAMWMLMAMRARVETQSSGEAITLNAQSTPTPFMQSFAAANLAPQTIKNAGEAPVDLTVSLRGVPAEPFEAGGTGYILTRSYLTLDGRPADLNQVKAGTRLVTVLKVTPLKRIGARLIINDPLPAGFEIDNPNLLRAGQGAALSWIKSAPTQMVEFRSDRFLAAVDWQEKKSFTLAYIVRAIVPGVYYHPAASVEDMYHPNFRANTASGMLSVVE